MPIQPTLIYWDSCVFLSYLNQDSDRLPVLDAVLNNRERFSAADISRSFVARDGAGVCAGGAGGSRKWPSDSISRGELAPITLLTIREDCGNVCTCRSRRLPHQSPMRI